MTPDSVIMILMIFDRITYVCECVFFKKTTLTPGCLVMLSSSTDCRNLDSVEEEIERGKNQTELLIL